MNLHEKMSSLWWGDVMRGWLLRCNEMRLTVADVVDAVISANVCVFCLDQSWERVDYESGDP